MEGAEARKDTGAEPAPHLSQALSGQECVPACPSVCPRGIPVLLPRLCSRSLRFARALPCAEWKVPPLRQLCSNESAIIALARAHVHTAACQEDICLCSPFHLASVLPFEALHIPPEKFLVRWLCWNSARCPPLRCCWFGSGYLIPWCRSAARCPLPTWCH